MIDLKKKCIKLASLAASLAVVGAMGVSAVYAAEEYTPSVPLKPYQPAIEQIVIDDNLEGNAEYPIATALTGSNSVTEEDTGNTAVKINNWNSIALIAANKPVNADSIVVSFDVKPTGADFATAAASGTFDTSMRSIIAFGLRAGCTGEKGVMLSGGSSALSDLAKETLRGAWVSGASPNKSDAVYLTIPQNNAENNGYVNVTAVFERRDNGVYLKGLYFDGTDMMTDALREGFNAEANWWEADSYTRLLLQNRTGKPLYNYYDNFLVYVPQSFRMADVELASDGKSATVSFNAALDRKKLPEFTLTDEDGEYSCDCSLTSNPNEVLVSFPKELDVEEHSYYLTYTDIVSGIGDVLAGKKILIGKDYVKKLEATAAKSQSGVSVSFDVTPGEASGDVYAMAILFNGDSIIDFKLEKLALDKSQGVNSFTLNMSDGDISAATRVQAFMIDSPKNMRIISGVSDISF